MMKSLIALPYEIARKPLGVVDGLAGRLPEDAAPRAAVDRALGTADKVAGTVLRNDGIARRGTDRLERSSKLRTAARLEKQAAARRADARETVADGREQAAAKRQSARKRVESGLAEADKVEARGKQQAKAGARKTAATKKSAADKRAASRSENVEQAEKRVEATAKAKKTAAQRRTKAELEEARETQQEAAEARADADRLEDLTNAKKEERKQA